MTNHARSDHAPLLSPSATLAIADVLRFWFGKPATDSAELGLKLQRWFRGGRALDEQIQESFGQLVVQALAGHLEEWRASVRGRVALVVLLDQFTRNIFRDTPRAYAGDPRALGIALGSLADGTYELAEWEHRLALTMPLVHSENLGHHDRAVVLTRELVAAAPAGIRDAASLGIGRTEHYRSVIARFGRFPHRNAILGRASTVEELAFLEEERMAPPPLPAPGPTPQGSGL